MNVLLMGPRACGKTTVGRLLAQRLNVAFVDLDSRTLDALGKPSVQQAWDDLGEQAWRDAERATLGLVLRGKNQVIALGGGTPIIKEAHHAIASAQREGTAQTVYLKCSEGTLAARLAAQPGDRPSLTGSAVHDEIRSILAAREPTYHELADFIVLTDGLSPDEAVTELERLLAPPR